MIVSGPHVAPAPPPADEGRHSESDRGFERDHLATRRNLLKLMALCCIVVFGATLRLLGISFGLPYHHHWDEWWIADSVVGMLRRHDDVPASYQYGEPLMRLSEFAFLLARWVRPTAATVTSVDSQTTVYLAARIVTALVSSTGIAAIYLAAQRSRTWFWASTGRSLSASLLYAVGSELVLHSRYAVTDACLVALTAWTLAFAAMYLAWQSIACGLLSVFAAGVTFAFKMPGIMTSLVPVLATGTLYVRASRLGQARRARGILLIAKKPRSGRGCEQPFAHHERVPSQKLDPRAALR